MRKPERASDADLTGYEVLVGVCGGIAAYKVCEAVSSLVQRGAGVSVVMTRSARRFITPLTFEALTGREVHTSLWRKPAGESMTHLHLTERANVFLVAPATANVLAKAAAGLADDLLSTMLVAADPPVVFAPAMNPRMWANPIVQRNVRALRETEHRIIEPEEGWLACRAIGPGRMAEPETIVDVVATQLLEKSPKRAASGEAGRS